MNGAYELFLPQCACLVYQFAVITSITCQCTLMTVENGNKSFKMKKDYITFAASIYARSNDDDDVVS